MRLDMGFCIAMGVCRACLVLIPCVLVLATVSCGGQPAGQPAPEVERQDTPGAPAARTAPETTVTTQEASGGEETDVALIEAARSGDAGAVRRLLQEGASVEARDGNGQTALIAAAYGNHLEVARLLIEAGADVNVQDGTQQGAYLIATSEVGDDPRLLRLALENGADVRSLDSYDGTGLIRAADRGNVEIVKELLKTETNVDHVNNLGWTALLEAVILGDGGPRYQEVVRLLVEEGDADPNLADGEGVTPLQHAEQRGYAEISETLRRAGAR